MNYFAPTMKKDEDELFKQGFDNPAAPEIDNKPGFMAQLVQGFLKAGATAAGGAAGGAAADAVSGSYNAAQEMPAAGQVAQQKMAAAPMAAGPMDYLQGPLANNSNMTASYNPTGMEMDKRIYDDFIIKDLLEQGIILPSEVQDIKRDGYKQVGGPLMGVA